MGINNFVKSGTQVIKEVKSNIEKEIDKNLRAKDKKKNKNMNGTKNISTKSDPDLITKNESKTEL